MTMKTACTFLLCLVAVTAALHADGYHYPGYFGGYHGGYYGYPGYHLGYGHNHEFDYRQFGGFPVHVGDGRFYFLGIYRGYCADGYNRGFYLAAEGSDSFIVCDHGREHHFQCPKGTKNRDHSYFVHNHAYGFSELCGEHTNEA